MLKTGKRPATYDPRDIRYTEVKAGATLPKIPSHFNGYGNDFRTGVQGWKMLGNGPCDDNSITDQSWAAFDGAGDCAWAGPAHETMMLRKNANQPVPRFTCLNVLDQYSQYSGYNLQSGANDNGSDVRDVLKWRQSKGLVDAGGGVHKIGIYASIEVANLTDLNEALYLFDAVGIGINFPGSAMDQFNAGKPWSVVNGASIEGGHYVPLVGHFEDDMWTCITWAKQQQVTSQFLTTYMDEAWCYITTERYNKVTGETPRGFKDIDLTKYISLVGSVQN